MFTTKISILLVFELQNIILMVKKNSLHVGSIGQVHILYTRKMWKRERYSEEWERDREREGWLASRLYIKVVCGVRGKVLLRPSYDLWKNLTGFSSLSSLYFPQGFFIKKGHHSMLLIRHGSSERHVHVWSATGNLICLRRLFASTAVVI